MDKNQAKSDRWEGTQKHNSYDIKNVYSRESISKQHVSAIHGHRQVFSNQLRFLHTNRVTELWCGDLNIKSLSNCIYYALGR
jgi:hypothetical protein